MSEPALLAVCADHPIGRQALVPADDPAGRTFLFAQDLPEY